SVTFNLVPSNGSTVSAPQPPAPALSLTTERGFGIRYPWYVRVVQQKVSENWLKNDVDQRVTGAQRVYLTFDINRDGRPSNVQIEQSSGVPSLDESALRALQRVSTFGPLPADYARNTVSVKFWFDYKP